MRVALTADAERQLDALPTVIRARVRKLLQRVARWPLVSGARPLQGDLAGHYRLRTGAYRMQFRIIEDVVLVHKIGHRDGFYDG